MGNTVFKAKPIDEIELKFADGKVINLSPSHLLSIAIFDDSVMIKKKDGTTAKFWRTPILSRCGRRLREEIVMDEIAVKSADGEITVFAASEIYSVSISYGVVMVTKKNGTTVTYYRKTHMPCYA